MKIDREKIEFRKLGKSEIGLMLALQNEVLEENEQNKETLRRNTAADCELCYNERSLVLGAFYGGLLIGYGILFFAGADHENLAYCLDAPSDLNDYANVKVIVVRRDYRGNGLQKTFLRIFEAHARLIPVKTLLCTVSPKNEYSGRNFLSCGYRFVKKVKKYGGLERDLYRKDLADAE
jgi:ribosomal protein S18 acetylase RimI-like enzyme